MKYSNNTPLAFIDEFSTRAINSMKAAGVDNFKKIMSCTKSEILRFRNSGVSVLKEVQAFQQKYYNVFLENEELEKISDKLIKCKVNISINGGSTLKFVDFCFRAIPRVGDSICILKRCDEKAFNDILEKCCLQETAEEGYYSAVVECVEFQNDGTVNLWCESDM